MKRLLEKKIITSGLGLALLTLLGVGWASSHSIARLTQEVKREISTQTELAAFKETLSTITDAETEELGYIITQGKRI